mmetsp:Transcript_4537/g.6848  ORF Transcript_4537/g.6848 Transcript_4537/m.6848 type:complete len:111 (+) Transcript_4537:1-333(+)
MDPIVKNVVALTRLANSIPSNPAFDLNSSVLDAGDGPSKSEVKKARQAARSLLEEIGTLGGYLDPAKKKTLQDKMDTIKAGEQFILREPNLKKKKEVDIQVASLYEELML